MLEVNVVDYGFCVVFDYGLFKVYEFEDFVVYELGELRIFDYDSFKVYEIDGLDIYDFGFEDNCTACPVFETCPFAATPTDVVWPDLFGRNALKEEEGDARWPEDLDWYLEGALAKYWADEEFDGEKFDEEEVDDLSDWLFDEFEEVDE